MSWLTRIFSSSIGRKFLAGLSGLGLFVFLIAHILGNLTLYAPDKGGVPAFNAYAKKLHDIPGFAVIEIGLMAAFVLHIVMVLYLAVTNRKARGDQRYATEGTKQPAESKLAAIASKTTVIGGMVILVFLVIHISDFAMNRWLSGNLISKKVIVEHLSVPWRAFLYMSGSLFVGWHLFHGVQSGFRTLGVRHPRYASYIQKIGVASAVLIGLGFASLPLAVILGVIK